MATTAEPVPRRSPRWRFALEVVLALLTVGLLTAWLVEHQPWSSHFWHEHFRGSDFMQQVTHEQFFPSICDRLVTGKSEWFSEGGGGTGRENLAQWCHVCWVRSPGVKPGRVFVEFHREVKELLAKHGCANDGGEHSSDPNNDDPYIIVAYSKGRIRGHLYLFAVLDDNNDRWRFVVVVNEHLT